MFLLFFSISQSTDIHRVLLVSQILAHYFLSYQYFFTTNISIKGCQVVKTPVYKGGCNLFEVVVGRQKVVKHPKGRLIREFYVCKTS